MSFRHSSWIYLVAGTALLGAFAAAPSALAAQRGHQPHAEPASARSVSDQTNSARVVLLARRPPPNGNNGNANAGNGSNGNGSNGNGNGQRRDDRGRDRDRDRDRDNHCQYPPTRVPHVALTILRVGPGHVHLTGTATVNGCRRGGHVMALYHSLDGTSAWHQETTVSTDQDGNGAFTVGTVPGGYYKLVVAGDDSFLPASSDPIRVG